MSVFTSKMSADFPTSPACCEPTPHYGIGLLALPARNNQWSPFNVEKHAVSVYLQFYGCLHVHTCLDITNVLQKKKYRCPCSLRGMWSMIHYAWLLKSSNFANCWHHWAIIVVVVVGDLMTESTKVITKKTSCVVKNIQCCHNTVN